MRAAKTTTIKTDEEDSVILSVRLASGRFESSIQVPLFCTDAEREKYVGAWLNLIEAGIKCGSEHRNKVEKAEVAP